MNTKKQGTPLVILYVEKDADISWTITQLLKVYGHHVTETESADQALALLNVALFDVVVSCTNPFGMRGLKLLSQVKALRPEVATVICNDFSDHVEFARYGRPDAVVQRPFGIAELNAALYQSLPA